MKEKIKKIYNAFKKNKIIVLIIILILSWFCWYEIRPYQIKKNCFKKTVDFSNEALKNKVNTIKNWDEAYNFYYKNCLRKKGL